MKHLKRRSSDPNFLFSTWPPIQWLEVPTVIVEPSGQDDTPQLRAAANRLAAVGGGMIRLRVGDFFLAGDLGTIVRPENLFLNR